jgi:hypothetical protein
MAATRTTLTLEPDVARLVDEEVHRARKTFKDVVNDAIRKGLGSGTDTRKVKRYRAPTHRCALSPGIDVTSFNRLLDDWDGDEGLRRAVGSK